MPDATELCAMLGGGRTDNLTFLVLVILESVGEDIISLPESRRMYWLGTGFRYYCLGGAWGWCTFVMEGLSFSRSFVKKKNLLRKLACRFCHGYYFIPGKNIKVWSIRSDSLTGKRLLRLSIRLNILSGHNTDEGCCLQSSYFLLMYSISTCTVPRPRLIL